MFFVVYCLFHSAGYLFIANMPKIDDFGNSTHTPAHMNHSSHGIWRPHLFISFVCVSMITQGIEQASYTIIILGASLPFSQCVLCVRQSRTHWDTFVLALLCILMALTVLYLLYSPRAVSTSCYHNFYSILAIIISIQFLLSFTTYTHAVQSFPFFVFSFRGRRMDGWQMAIPSTVAY
jgi:hypothetical protein